MNRKMLVVVSSVLLLIVGIVGVQASFFWAYQPKAPKCLAK
jgi:cyclic lactone autoinducer peptide